MEVVRPQLNHRWISVFVLICLFSFEAQCFYLPGVAPQDFMKVSFSSCSVGFVVIRWLCWDIGGLRLNDEENISSMLFFCAIYVCIVCDLLYLHDYVEILEVWDRILEKKWTSLLISLLIYVLCVRFVVITWLCKDISGWR